MESGEVKLESLKLDSAPQNRRRRPSCGRCMKPITVCICSRIKFPPIDNTIGVTILQHSLEGKHHLNSVRVASLGLRNLAVVPVTDVLFQVEYTIRPLDDSSRCLKLVSNASALSKFCSIDDNGDDGGDDERFRAGIFDEAVIWTDGHGGESVRAILENKKAGSGNEISYSKNGVILVKNSKPIDKMTADISASPMPLEKDPSSVPDEEGCTTTVESESYKITCSCNSVRISLKRTARPDLSKTLPKQVLESLTSNGFSVQRMQTRGKRGGKNLGIFEEFHLLIPPGSAILFPGKASVDLHAVDFDVRHLILLDGTWDKARRMFHENPWLQLLPRIKLATKGESIYKEVRHQPKPGCLSTVESIVSAFKVLNKDHMEGLDELLEVFESMVADQRRLKDENFSRLSAPKNI